MQSTIALFVLCFIALSTAYKTDGAVPVQGVKTCAFCEFVVTTVEAFVTSNSTETQIIGWLNKACNLLPSPYSTLCAQEVQSQGPQIVEWIIKKESPEVLCSQLHLCVNTTKTY